MKSVKEIKALKDDALVKRLEDLQKELMRYRSQVASGTIPKNPGKIRVIRKTIARIMTEQTGRRTQRNGN